MRLNQAIRLLVCPNSIKKKSVMPSQQVTSMLDCYPFNSPIIWRKTNTSGHLSLNSVPYMYVTTYHQATNVPAVQQAWASSSHKAWLPGVHSSGTPRCPCSCIYRMPASTLEVPAGNSPPCWGSTGEREGPFVGGVPLYLEFEDFVICVTRSYSRLF